jgi:hypothetical protein
MVAFGSTLPVDMMKARLHKIASDTKLRSYILPSLPSLPCPPCPFNKKSLKIVKNRLQEDYRNQVIKLYNNGKVKKQNRF